MLTDGPQKSAIRPVCYNGPGRIRREEAAARLRLRTRPPIIPP